MKEEQIKLIKPDNQKIIELLVNKYGLIKYKVINKVIKLNTYYDKFKDY